jgi:hypothetical protein
LRQGQEEPEGNYIERYILEEYRGEKITTAAVPGLGWAVAALDSLYV